MKILVLTEHDDCCGPMAAAFLRDYSSKLEVLSAGRNPSPRFEPMMAVAMKECLIDLSGYCPEDLGNLDVSNVDKVYECPDQPCPATLDECRRLRDLIKNEAFLFFRSLTSNY